MRYNSMIAGAVLAAMAVPALAQDAEIGAGLYRTHCATCHGIEGAGQGPMAGALVIKPADLTGLSLRNGGTFPVERVVKRIDGRDPLVSHGSPMPVYGHFFEGSDRAVKTPSGQPIMTSAAVVDLLGYLQTIQRN